MDEERKKNKQIRLGEREWEQSRSAMRFRKEVGEVREDQRERERERDHIKVLFR